LNKLIVDMQVRGDAPPCAFATAVPALFEALADVFAPLDVVIGHGHIARLDPVRVFNTVPLWCDEELTRDPLTRCLPTLGTDVIAELHEACADLAPPEVIIDAQGALLHRAAHTAAPAWYGRWCSEQLRDIISVHVRWTERSRGFALHCELGGYPFTATRLTTNRATDGDAAIAAENRALWLPALCRVRAAFGFDREEVEWRVLGDAAARKDWLPHLRAS
jgi:hypothetical protein